MEHHQAGKKHLSVLLNLLIVGIDNSVATYGGVIKFCSGLMTPQLALEGLNILLTNTGVGRNTRLLVAAVRERYDKFPEVMEPIMEATDKLSLAVLNTLQTCREKQFSGCEKEFRILEVKINMVEHMSVMVFP